MKYILHKHSKLHKYFNKYFNKYNFITQNLKTCRLLSSLLLARGAARDSGTVTANHNIRTTIINAKN